MRELLGAYFTHEYHYLPVFQKDYFLEDMANTIMANQGTSCCSKLLVNATLAYACYCSTKISYRFKYWEPEGLGYRFLAEAKRIWELQAISGRYHNLTSVQAALIINVVYTFCALDKIGHAYLLQGFAIAQDLQLFHGNAHVKSERVRNARNFTAWALFNMDSHFAWHFSRRPFLIKPPQFTPPDPSMNPAWYGEIWTRYPLSQTLSPTHYAHVFKATSDLRVIYSDLSHASFGKDTKISTQQAQMFVARLIRWYKHLPTVLTPKHIVLPAHFIMHLDYQLTLLAICQSFIDCQWDNGQIPKTIVTDAERDINVLMRLYYFRHGFGATDVYLPVPLSKLGFMSLQNINNQMSQQELDYNRSTLLLTLIGLREQGRNYSVATTVYRVLKNQLRPEEARLLHGSEDPEAVSEEIAALADEIQSAWSPCIVDISSESVGEELSKLAKQFLTIDSGAQCASGSGDSSPSAT